jgi:stearoyl-CoA 9-desaturase NADPH oxidoreductase
MLDSVIWNNPWLRPFNDVAAIDDLLTQIHPTWALGAIKARVVALVTETADTTTFALAPNRNWPGFHAGQHVGVDVEIGGVRHQRRYSLSSVASRRRRIAITVKRQPGGVVSSWLHDRVRPGDVLRLSAPSGAFTLPDPPPAKLLLLAGGSGITPLMSMLRSLRDAAADVTLVDVARRPEDAIFDAELRALAKIRPAFRRYAHYSADAGRFDPRTLAQLVPDYAERLTMLCGPAGLMASCREHWETRGIASRLHVESFGVATVATTDAAHEIRCTRSERVFTAGAEAPLLVAAERAGLRPRYGCRMGICHSCVCVKRSGTVENLLTGQLSTEPNTRIQLCISRARTTLSLEL